MDQFFIQCDINSELLQQLRVLKPHHLNYIKNKNNILYGGVMLDETDKYKGMCYVIKADSISEAENFVKGDPYFEIYRKYEISKFIQKIPE